MPVIEQRLIQPDIPLDQLFVQAEASRELLQGAAREILGNAGTAGNTVVFELAANKSPERAKALLEETSRGP